MESKRELLRHALSTLAYRAAKVLRDSPPGFATFKVGETTRSPREILAHMSDLIDWALSVAKGQEAWHPAPSRPWEDEVGRFFEALGKLDAFLASEATLSCRAERIFQGPIADVLTHVGQIAMLRRLAGSRIQPENYSEAKIALGRVGEDQTSPPGERG